MISYLPDDRLDLSSNQIWQYFQCMTFVWSLLSVVRFVFEGLKGNSTNFTYWSVFAVVGRYYYICQKCSSSLLWLQRKLDAMFACNKLPPVISGWAALWLMETLGFKTGGRMRILPHFYCIESLDSWLASRINQRNWDNRTRVDVVFISHISQKLMPTSPTMQPDHWQLKFWGEFGVNHHGVPL